MAYTVFSAYYDLLTRDVDYKQRADYFSAIIQNNMADPELLLDLACGTGSLSLELAKLGYEVIGADGSYEMLSFAMQKSLTAERRILFLHQQMEGLDLYGTVDAAVCALDSLNHVTDKEKLARIFQRLSLFIRPGGLFVFDVNTPYKHREILADNTFIYEEGPVFCVWRNEYIPETEAVDIRLDFFCREGVRYRRETEEFRERAYAQEELAALLEQAGFGLEAEYEGDTLMPLSEKSQRAVYVARRHPL